MSAAPCSLHHLGIKDASSWRALRQPEVALAGSTLAVASQSGLGEAGAVGHVLVWSTREKTLHARWRHGEGSGYRGGLVAKAAVTRYTQASSGPSQAAQALTAESHWRLWRMSACLRDKAPAGRPCRAWRHR